MGRKMNRKAVRWLFMAILLIAIGLRQGGIGKNEPWHDEAFSMLEALGCRFDAASPGQGFTRADLEANRTVANTIAANQFMDSGNGPLFVIALHAWSKLLGVGTVTFRLFSLLWFVITMLLAFRLSRILFDSEGAALLSAAVLAITMLLLPVHIRPYQMGTALALACTLQLVLALRTRVPSWRQITLYALLVIASLLTHFSTAYVLLAHPFVALIHRAPVRTWVRLMAGGAVSILAVTAWLLTIGQPGLEMMAKHNAYYADIVQVTPDPGSFFRATDARTLIEGIALQGAWAMSISLSSTGMALRGVALLMMIPWMLIIVTCRTASSVQHRHGIGALSALMFTALAYSSILAVISGHTVSFMAYYATFVTPYWALLVGHVTWSAFKGEGRSRTLRLTLTAGTWAVLIASVLNPPAGPPIAPERSGLHAKRWESAVDRYASCSLAAIHSSKTAAYLSAWLDGDAAARLHHYVVPQYPGISGLRVECDGRSWMVPIRERDDRYWRSQPKDDETWRLEHGPAPGLPDSVDRWQPQVPVLRDSTRVI